MTAGLPVVLRRVILYYKRNNGSPTRFYRRRYIRLIQTDAQSLHQRSSLIRNHKIWLDFGDKLNEQRCAASLSKGAYHSILLL